MNVEILEMYNSLYPHVFQLQVRWSQFRFLFTKGNKRMAVLENTAPTFFHIIRDVLRDDTFITLSRLTDNSEIGKNKNLSLNTLVELAESSDDIALASSARRILNQLIEIVNNIRTWRNKWLAHLDLEQAMSEKPLPDTPVTRGDVDQAIDLVIELMNLFASHLTPKSFSTDLPIVIGDADVLAQLLESMQET